MSGNAAINRPDSLAMSRVLVSILAQLPDDLAESLRILEMAKQIVVEFNSPCPVVCEAA